MEVMIFVKETDIPKTKTRKAFLKRFLVEGGYKTYTATGEIQCENPKAYRSVTELHAMVCTRFKNTSLKAIVRIIDEIIQEEKNIVLVWCTQVNKVVIKRVKNTPQEYITDYSKRNYFNSKGVDGYSLKDYEDIRNSI